jgi:hypothetical protein
MPPALAGSHPVQCGREGDFAYCFHLFDVGEFDSVSLDLLVMTTPSSLLLPRASLKYFELRVKLLTNPKWEVRSMRNAV